MKNSLFAFLVVVLTSQNSFSSASEPPNLQEQLQEQYPEIVFLRTDDGVRAMYEEPTPYPRADFEIYMRARNLAGNYAPNAPREEAEENLRSVEKLLGDKSFTPARDQFYRTYLRAWLQTSDFRERVSVLTEYEDFLFPPSLPVQRETTPPSLFLPTYLLDPLAQAGQCYPYDRSVLLPSYLSQGPEELHAKIKVLIAHKEDLFSNAFGPNYSRRRAHMMRGLMQQSLDSMESGLVYARAQLKIESSHDLLVNMMLLENYACHDPALQQARLKAVDDKIPALAPAKSQGTDLYLLRKSTCSSLPETKIEKFAMAQSQVFFTDCEPESPHVLRVVGTQEQRTSLSINNFLVRIPEDKILPFASFFVNLNDIPSAENIRNLSLALSKLSHEQLQTIIECYQDLRTPNMQVADVVNFAVFERFSGDQIRASARLFRSCDEPSGTPFSFASWSRIPHLVYHFLSAEQISVLLSSDAETFIRNLGRRARQVFIFGQTAHGQIIFGGMKVLDAPQLENLFAHGLGLFPKPLNKDPKYLMETTSQIKELEPEEIPMLATSFIDEVEPPSSPRIAHAVELLVQKRGNTPRGMQAHAIDVCN